jgi:hypothetical protein
MCASSKSMSKVTSLQSALGCGSPAALAECGRGIGIYAIAMRDSIGIYGHFRLFPIGAIHQNST